MATPTPMAVCCDRIRRAIIIMPAITTILIATGAHAASLISASASPPQPPAAASVPPPTSSPRTPDLSPMVWNTTIPGIGSHALIGAAFGWGKIYITTPTGTAVFLDNSTGKVITSAPIPNEGCYIWSATIAVVPLPTAVDLAVVAGNNSLSAFRGTQLGKSALWTSPYFACTNIQAVSSQAVVVTNFTNYGFVSTADGSMWTLQYSTYDTHSDVDANVYLIEPNTSTLAVLVTVWPSFTSGNTTHTLYNGATGEVIWRNSVAVGVVSWFQYSPSSDLLVEFNTPGLLQARDWRSWDAQPVWKASESTLSGSYQRVTVAGDLVYLYDGTNGQIEALHIRTGVRVWHVESSDASSAKNVDIEAGSKYFYHSFSYGEGDYMKVTVEKRSAADGTLVWARKAVATVQYGWFRTSLSDDESLLYIWAGTQGAWLAALDTTGGTELRL